MLITFRTVCPFRFFFFNDTATTEIYTLSLHDALPICKYQERERDGRYAEQCMFRGNLRGHHCGRDGHRSEEHTSELQSRLHLVCRLLLEKKKTKSLKKYPSGKSRLPRPHIIKAGHSPR